MLGKQLSRWTMAWFASALAFLLTALGLAVLGVGGPGRWSDGSALAMLHLFALGWLCQMMLGSLIQFAPVLTARPLALPRLALPTLLLSAMGTAMLALGFLALGGWQAGRWLLVVAPGVLGLAFALAGAMLGTTLIAAGSWRQPEGRAVLAALAALLALWLTGGLMALALAGFGGPGTMLLPQGLPLHVLLGAGLWLSLAAMGVSYKLFSMFLLAPECDTRLRRTAFATALTSLALVLIALPALLIGGTAGPATALAAGAAVLAAVLYLAEIRNLWQTRRRPKPEINMQMSRAALAFLGLAAILLLPAIGLGGAWAEAAVFVALAGWLSTLTLAQMVKIVSFLTWIQVFAPRIGRAKVPMVHELTDARPTRRWLCLWIAGVLIGTLALLAGWPLMFRLAALALLLAVLGLGGEALAIRRLRHLPHEQRPAGLPPLILPPPLQSAPDDHTRTARA